MRIRSPLSATRDMIYGIAGVLFLVVLWCVLTYGGFIKPLFLPSPTQVWNGLMHYQELGWLMPAMARSFSRVMLSLVLVVLIGTPIGILMGAFTPVDSALNRIFNAMKAVPPTGLVGLIILWFSVEEKAKIVFLFLGSIFYMILLVRNAVASVKEEYVLVGRDIGASNSQILFKILLPGALPQIWESIVVCNGIMWTYIVLAEYINSNEEQMGLGYLLQVGSKTFQSGQVYGTLILIGAIAFFTDWFLKLIQKKFLAW